MSKFDHQVKDGKVDLRSKAKPETITIKELKARLEALEAVEKKRDPLFKIGSVK